MYDLFASDSERDEDSLPKSDDGSMPFPFADWEPSLLGCEIQEVREKQKDSPLNKMMRMAGLKEVKREFLSVRDRVRAVKSQKRELPSIRSLQLDLLISGNSGTEALTIAQLYADYLEFLGVLSGCCSGSGSSCGINEPKAGIIILHNKVSLYGHDPKLHVLIGVGSREHIRNVLGHSWAHKRFRRRIHLKEQSEEDSFAVMIKRLKDDLMKVEGGFNAPFLRMFIRKLWDQQQGSDDLSSEIFESEIKQVLRRRAEHLETDTQKKDNVIANISSLSYYLVESDFYGANPSNFYEESESWKKLNRMIGMEKVKEAVTELVSRRNIRTGKTTVAALFGQIIADLGYLESREVILKKPTDFLGSYVGHSEERTKDIMEETKGKILIIDEAHMFYHSSDYGTDGSDIFRKGILDTIVAHVDGEPGSNRCIILMGYPDRMKEMYRNTNPGFQRRFPLKDAFEFGDYDDATLGHILDLMMTHDNYAATDDAKAVAMELLRRQRDLPNFGNGGDVRNLLSRAYITRSKRKTDNGDQTQVLLKPLDFDPQYDRGRQTAADFHSLFHNLVGFQKIIGTFEDYQTMAANMKAHGLDPREEIPFTFIFKGPPGTGKTTTARALGHMYYSMGLLSTTEVMDCSVTDLIGTSIGRTGPKVQNLLERALGKVLLIDEAYRLGIVANSYVREAVGKLVDCMTKERYAQKLVIVLAGYEKSMDLLMGTNEGLRGRFPEMVFPSMRPKDCLRLLQKMLLDKKTNILRPSQRVQDNVLKLFEKLAKTEAWANARDVGAIAKEVVRRLFLKPMAVGQPVEVTLEEISMVLKRFYRDRKSNAQGGESSGV